MVGDVIEQWFQKIEKEDGFTVSTDDFVQFFCRYDTDSDCKSHFTIICEYVQPYVMYYAIDTCIRK